MIEHPATGFLPSGVSPLDLGVVVLFVVDVVEWALAAGLPREVSS